jgi:hypothetical protein
VLRNDGLITLLPVYLNGITDAYKILIKSFGPLCLDISSHSNLTLRVKEWK